jgi:cytochrome c oxidase subunit 4
MADKSHEHHILPLQTYFNVFIALICLTVVTVLVAQYDFGALNLLVAMIIAGVKATLVALIFMHLKYDNKIYAVIFVGALLFLAVFIIITMFDTLRRGDIYEIKSGPIEPNAVIYRDTATEMAPAIVDTTAAGDSTVVDTVSIDK